ncbi:MAG TPA: nucleotidyl transferase AbiEii/AbiGii toxin family protein [Terriglobia bacterium]|jgi:predicted nucleotidyltransferase component of viral defense system
MQNADWHPEVLPEEAKKTLARLSRMPVLASFYLAGGTALALQLGYRTSVDLDFFSSETVEEDPLLSKLQCLAGLAIQSKAPETLHLHIGSTKVSFLGYHYPILFPFTTYEGVAVADPRDIAAMKLTAIASRGTKRDFVDLYVLSQQYGLDEILRLLERKFSPASFSDIHLKKSLTYFADAEKDPMPHMLRPMTWSQVKQYFLTIVPKL